MAKPPPKIVIKIPPSVGKKTGSQYTQFINFWAKHYPGLTPQLAQSILNVAHAENVDPIFFASLILSESGANNAAVSSKGAIGIGQLMPSSFIGPNAFNGGVLPWASNHKITMADLKDQGTNMRLAAAYYGYLTGTHPTNPYGYYVAGPNADPTLAASIQQSYNARFIQGWNPKYVGTSTPTGPPGKAGQQVPGGTALPAPDIPFKNPYVAGINAHNKFVTTNDPNKALQYNGAPLTRSGFLSIKDQITSHYISYTGQRPSNHMIQTFLQKGWSTFTLDTILSQGKNFSKSPIYKSQGIPLQNAMKNLLPKGAMVPHDLMRRAVLYGWDANTLAAELRKLPTYTHSNEFSGTVASLLNVHSSIMGSPNQQDMVAIKDAALAGWSTDQYAAWLRSQDSYRFSKEGTDTAMGLMDALGLVTGNQPTLVKGAAGSNPGGLGPSVGALFGDKRVPGTPGASPQMDLGWSFNAA